MHTLLINGASPTRCIRVESVLRDLKECFNVISDCSLNASVKSIVIINVVSIVPFPPVFLSNAYHSILVMFAFVV